MVAVGWSVGTLLFVGVGTSVGRADAVGFKVALAVGGMDVSVATGETGVLLETGAAEAGGLAVADAAGVPLCAVTGVLVGGTLDGKGVTAATDLGEGVMVDVACFPIDGVEAGVGVRLGTPTGVEDLIGCGVAVALGFIVTVAKVVGEAWVSGVFESNVDKAVGVA